MSKLHEISGCEDDARKADVVFLHGLGGDAFGTWRHLSIAKPHDTTYQVCEEVRHLLRKHILGCDSRESVELLPSQKENSTREQPGEVSSTPKPPQTGRGQPEEEGEKRPQDPKLDDLREMIAKRQVVLVVGSGVSIVANPASPTWRRLIELGVAHCRGIGAKSSWCDQVASQLNMEDDPDMLLSAAELVDKKLSEGGGGELARWLRDVFEKLQPESPAIIQALAALDLPLVTTNYDDLIEKATGLRPVSWTDESVVTRVIRGDDRRVVHLHGHWEDRDSVVLGIRSYEAVKNNEHTQAVMKAFGLNKSFLFVGCGEEGLADPNWGSFLSWLEAVETGAGVEHRHYRLVREDEVFEPRGRIYPLVYGKQYEDLTPFLQNL